MASDDADAKLDLVVGVNEATMEPNAEGEPDFKWLDVGVDASSGSTDSFFCTLEPTPFPDSREGFGDITRRQREAPGNAQAAGSSCELAPQQSGARER